MKIESETFTFDFGGRRGFKWFLAVKNYGFTAPLFLNSFQNYSQNMIW